MSMSVKIDNLLFEQAKNRASAEHPTITGQIEFWPSVGLAAINNTELPVDFFEQVLA